MRPDARGQVPRVDAVTTKVNRIEACFWGSLGLAKTRDAYLASTKAGEPTAEKLPEFGEFPEHEKRADALKKAGRETKTKAINLPYLRHLRACKHAKSGTDAEMKEIDAALTDWEAYASQLHETLVKATRYYSRDGFTKDEFKEGKAHHEKLKELLPQLDEKFGAFAAAMKTWRDANKDYKPKEELDEGGKVAHEALQKAQAATELLMADKRDKAAIDAAIAEVQKLYDELETIRTEQRRPPHPKVVGPKLKEFIDAATAAAQVEGDGKLSADQLYAPTSGLALLFELNQRSIEQLLRQRSAVNKKPLRAADPRSMDEQPAADGDSTKRVRRGLRQE